MRKLLMVLMVLGLVGMCFGVDNTYPAHAYYGGPLLKAAAKTVWVGPIMTGLTYADGEILIAKNDGAFAARGAVTTTPTESTNMYPIAIGADDLGTEGRLTLILDDSTIGGGPEVMVWFDVLSSKAYTLRMSGTVDVDTINGAAPFDSSTDKVLLADNSVTAIATAISVAADWLLVIQQYIMQYSNGL